MENSEVKLEGKRILVVGATGQIGRGLVHILAKTNEVHAAARFTRPAVREELAKVCRQLHVADLSSREGVELLPRDYDIVFNMAVLWGSYRAPEERNWDLFVETMRVNSFLPGRLIMHFRDTGAKMVFGSTGGLYTPSKGRDDPAREGVTCWEGGGNIYEDGKMGNDIIVSWLTEDYGVPAILLRYFWPVSPYHSGAMFGQAARAILDGKPIRVSSKNPWWQNVGYISDFVYASIAAANLARSPAPIYNVTGDDIVSAREIAFAVGEALGREPIFDEVEVESRHSLYVADVSMMKQDLWAPRVHAKECARRVVRAIREDIHSPQDWMFD